MKSNIAKCFLVLSLCMGWGGEVISTSWRGHSDACSEFFHGYEHMKCRVSWQDKELSSLKSQLTTKNNEVSQLQSQLTAARENITTEKYTGSPEEVSELLTTLRNFLGDEVEEEEETEQIGVADLIRRFKEMQ